MEKRCDHVTVLISRRFSATTATVTSLASSLRRLRPVRTSVWCLLRRLLSLGGVIRRAGPVFQLRNGLSSFGSAHDRDRFVFG